MHFILSILLVSLLGTSQEGTSVQDKADSIVSVSPSQLADAIESQAKTYLGKPYRYGARGPKAFDCSGFVGFIYDKFGYKLGRSSSDQFKDGRPVEGDLSKLQKGDIVTFSGSRNNGRPGHSGIFLSPDPDGRTFTFIHADRRGVRISKSSEEYYDKRFLGARRIIPDFIASDGSEGLINEEYGEDMKKSLPVRDTLQIGEGDLRIVLLSKGSWYLSDNEGNLRMSESDSTLVLEPGGKWRYIANSKVSIPSGALTDQKNSADVAPPSREEAEYYVIR